MGNIFNFVAKEKAATHHGIDIIFRKSVTACSILLNDIYYCKYDGTGYALRFGGVLSYFMFRMSILCGGFLCLRTYFVILDAKMYRI